ncbi:hypothetical protein STEG23_034461 [Scotinomys teguina]
MQTFISTVPIKILLLATEEEDSSLSLLSLETKDKTNYAMVSNYQIPSTGHMSLPRNKIQAFLQKSHSKKDDVLRKVSNKLDLDIGHVAGINVKQLWFIFTDNSPQKFLDYTEEAKRQKFPLPPLLPVLPPDSTPVPTPQIHSSSVSAKKGQISHEYQQNMAYLVPLQTATMLFLIAEEMTHAEFTNQRA